MDTRSETRGEETKHHEEEPRSSAFLEINILDIIWSTEYSASSLSSHLISSTWLLIPSHSPAKDNHNLRSRDPYITFWAPFSLSLFPALFLWRSFRTMPYYFSWVPFGFQQWSRHISLIVSALLLLPLRPPVSAVCKRRKKHKKKKKIEDKKKLGKKGRKDEGEEIKGEEKEEKKWEEEKE